MRVVVCRVRWGRELRSRTPRRPRPRPSRSYAGWLAPARRPSGGVPSTASSPPHRLGSVAKEVAGHRVPPVGQLAARRTPCARSRRRLAGRRPCRAAPGTRSAVPPAAFHRRRRRRSRRRARPSRTPTRSATGPRRGRATRPRHGWSWPPLLMKLWVRPRTSPCLPSCLPSPPHPQPRTGRDGPQIALRSWRTRWRLGETPGNAVAVADRVVDDAPGVVADRTGGAVIDTGGAVMDRVACCRMCTVCCPR